MDKIGWSRAARTDKGVHAIYNCVSCKLTLEKNYFNSAISENEFVKQDFKIKFDTNELIRKINQDLEHIKIFGSF